ncbi:hypothetical protein BC834DRAFT_408389 [Gloeopeniophorella convolvens]|nr:hypothetical protein BC834DRAFT_408389 [Gloeopeniophorella convolvens]
MRRARLNGSPRRASVRARAHSVAQIQILRVRIAPPPIQLRSDHGPDRDYGAALASRVRAFEVRGARERPGVRLLHSMYEVSLARRPRCVAARRGPGVCMCKYIWAGGSAARQHACVVGDPLTHRPCLDALEWIHSYLLTKKTPAPTVRGRGCGPRERARRASMHAWMNVCVFRFCFCFCFCFCPRSRAAPSSYSCSILGAPSTHTLRLRRAVHSRWQPAPVFRAQATAGATETRRAQFGSRVRQWAGPVGAPVARLPDVGRAQWLRGLCGRGRGHAPGQPRGNAQRRARCGGPPWHRPGFTLPFGSSCAHAGARVWRRRAQSIQQRSAAQAPHLPVCLSVWLALGAVLPVLPSSAHTIAKLCQCCARLEPFPLHPIPDRANRAEPPDCLQALPCPSHCGTALAIVAVASWHASGVSAAATGASAASSPAARYKRARPHWPRVLTTRVCACARVRILPDGEPSRLAAAWVHMYSKREHGATGRWIRVPDRAPAVHTRPPVYLTRLVCTGRQSNASRQLCTRLVRARAWSTPARPSVRGTGCVQRGPAKSQLDPRGRRSLACARWALLDRYIRSMASCSWAGWNRRRRRRCVHFPQALSRADRSLIPASVGDPSVAPISTLCARSVHQLRGVHMHPPSPPPVHARMYHCAAPARLSAFDTGTSVRRAASAAAHSSCVLCVSHACGACTGAHLCLARRGHGGPQLSRWKQISAAPRGLLGVASSSSSCASPVFWDRDKYDTPNSLLETALRFVRLRDVIRVRMRRLR